MRSRYSAFSLGTPESVSYLVATHHPDFRAKDLERDLAVSVKDTRWTSLNVRNAGESGDTGVVDFVAGFVYGGQVGELRECSQFVREKGRWFYTTGS